MAIEDARYFSILVACRAADQTLANRLFSELGEGEPFTVGIHRIGQDPTVPAFYGALYARVRPGSERFKLLRDANDGTAPTLDRFADGTTQAEVDQVFGNLVIRYTWTEDETDIDARAYFIERLEALNYAPTTAAEPEPEPVDIAAAAAAVRGWLIADNGANAKAVRNRAGAAMQAAHVAAGGAMTTAQAKAAAEAFMVEAFGIPPTTF